MKKNAKQLLLLLTLFGLAGGAIAADPPNYIDGPSGKGSVWTVYAFGNAQAIADAFYAIYNFTTSSVFSAILSFVAIVGIIAVGLTSGFQPGSAKKFIGYIVSVIFISYLFTGFGNFTAGSDDDGPITVRVEVIDTVNGMWKAPVTVPAVLGIPASIVSTAGHEITRAIEASFQLPDALKMSNGAPFNLMAAMINDTTKAKITDANLSTSLAYYIQDCFTSGVANGSLSVNALLTSTNFLDDIKYNNQAIMVNTALPADTPDGQTAKTNGTQSNYSTATSHMLVDCVEAHNRIKNRVEAGGEVGDYLNHASAWSSTPALSTLASAADAVAMHASNSTATSGAQMVKQAAVLSTFIESQSSVAANTGNSDYLTTIAMKQAEKSRFNSWIVGAELFNRIMGYIYAILQVFVYSLAPIMFIAALIPGVGASLLKSFLQVLVWMALWQPLLAIVNFVVIALQFNDLGGVMMANGTFGISLNTMGIVTEKSTNLRAAGAVIGTMVPLLAWGMVKGAIDMTKFVTTASAEQFNSVAANTLTTGNYSLNQASMDSFSANKNSIASNAAFGGGFSTNDGIGTRKNELGGEISAISGTSAATTVQATAGVGDNATASRQGTVVESGVRNITGGTASNASRVGNRSTTGAEATGAATVDSLAASASIGGGIRTGGGAGAGGGGGGSGGSGGPDASAAKPSGVFKHLESKPSNFNPQASADIKANAQRANSKTKTNTQTKSAAAGTAGNISTTGSDTYAYSAGGQVNESGATSRAANNGLTNTATAISGPSARAAAYNQPIEQVQRQSAFGRAKWKADVGSELYKDLYGASNTTMDKAAAAAQEPNLIANQQHAILNSALATQTAAQQKTDDNEKKAKARKAEADRAAAAEIGASRSNAGALSAPAFNSLGENTAAQLLQDVKTLRDASAPAVDKVLEASKPVMAAVERGWDARGAGNAEDYIKADPTRFNHWSLK